VFYPACRWFADFKQRRSDPGSVTCKRAICVEEILGGDHVAAGADYQTALFTIAPALFAVMQNYL